MAKRVYWTVVQHSGFGYADNPQFEAGLETRYVIDGRFQNKIRTLGGKLFEDYDEAEDYCMDEMYGPFDGIIPLTPPAPSQTMRLTG